MANWMEILLQILCIIALLLIIWWRIKPAVLFKKRAVETRGTIVNWLKTNIGGKVYFYPMIEFVDQEGKLIRFKASERSEREPMYKTGTQVIIKYDPKNTDRKKVAYPKKSR